MKTAVIGTGLIGGSILMALRQSGWECKGFDPSSSAQERFQLEPSIEKACVDAEVVVIATPVGAMNEVIDAVAETRPVGCVVTDVGSVKQPIVSYATEKIGEWFVGGHPMAGTEGQGAESARGDLFSSAVWLLCPTEVTNPEALARVELLVTSVGATPLHKDVEEHDQLVALVSHLPYAMATVLAANVATRPEAISIAAGNFRDLTRVGGTSQKVWLDILRANHDSIGERIDEFTDSLRRFKDALASDPEELLGIMERAAATRNLIPFKRAITERESVVLQVTVADRKGALAAMTKAVGEAGVNIEDLFMSHAGGSGFVELVVSRAAASMAQHALEAADFNVVVV